MASLSNDEDIFSLECRINHTTCQVQEAISKDGQFITILGFGSLLSERSSRLTFPNLHNFRLVRVPHYRRVFAHPTSIFLRRGIANLSTLEMASLSCEYDAADHVGFLATAFEIPVAEMVEPASGSYRPSPAFVEREEEFAIIPVPYTESDAASDQATKVGMICAQSTDEIYFHKWGRDHFQKHFGHYGITTIWNWPRQAKSDDLGFLRPCAIYLYHCCLAAQNMGPECYASFLDETFLVDRTTTLRQYLEQYPRLLEEVVVPPELQDRYCG